MRLVFNYANCTIVMKYLGKVPGSDNWYYIRRIPGDVQRYYPAKKDKRLVKSTRTSNRQEAAQRALRIDRDYERDWERLRSGLSDLSHGTRERAVTLLGKFGLSPGSSVKNRELELEHFYDSIEASLTDADRRQLFDANAAKVLGYEGVATEQEVLRRVMSDEHRVAYDMVNGQFEWTAWLIYEEFLRLKKELVSPQRGSAPLNGHLKSWWSV
jgi:hypothetical protein